MITDDEQIRPDTTVDTLAKLRPAFTAEGTVTAASSSPISDGAAAVVVMSENMANELGLPWLAEIGAYGSVAGPDNSLLAQPANAINRALATVPRDRVRLHVCWGNYEGPHDMDVPLSEILPILRQAQVGGFVFPFANPRHAHEYRCFAANGAGRALQDDQVLVAGVIDTLTNFVEHPEVVADRICQVVEAIGDRSRVIASVDCGFGTFAGSELVAASVVWAKLQTLQEGAALATKRLWG